MKSYIVLLIMLHLLLKVEQVYQEQCNSQKDYLKTLERTQNSLRRQLIKCNEKTRCPTKGPVRVQRMAIMGLNPFPATCKENGWMVIQRRFSGSEKFNRGWKFYKNGFGNFNREFFIGLEKLYIITKAKQYELYIKLRDVRGNNRYAQYDHFEIGSEKESYVLRSVGNYSGTAGDSLSYHVKMKFSTFDRDNDYHLNNCAKYHHGGWWFKKCAISSLNGNYYRSGRRPYGKYYGIFWASWNKDYDFNMSLGYVEMMIRPKCLLFEIL